MAAAGLACGWVYLRQERRATVPVMPLETWLGRGPVGSSMLATMCVTGGYIGAGVFLPLYLQDVRGESAFTAGLVLSAAGMSWTVGSLIGVQFKGEARRRAMRIASAATSLGATAMAVEVALGPFPLWLNTLTWVAAAIGVGVSLLHLMNWAISFSPPERSGANSAAYQTCRMLGSAAGSALMGALLHGIGADPDHIRTAIVAIFVLSAAFTMLPATFLRPRLPRLDAAEPHSPSLVGAEA